MWRAWAGQVMEVGSIAPQGGRHPSAPQRRLLLGVSGAGGAARSSSLHPICQCCEDTVERGRGKYKGVFRWRLGCVDVSMTSESVYLLVRRSLFWRV